MQRFSLRSQLEEASDPVSERKVFSILLVEDNPADVTLVREALEEHGVEGELFVATDGEMAMKAIQDIEADLMNCPDLFIVDLNIPRKPGREVVERMRRSERCKQSPLVILSSSDSARDKEDARRLGVSEYLRKPSRLHEFLSLGAIFKGILGRSAD